MVVVALGARMTPRAVLHFLSLLRKDDVALGAYFTRLILVGYLLEVRYTVNVRIPWQ